MEYALTVESFMKICQKYTLHHMFRGEISRVALTQDVYLSKGTTKFLYGEYNEVGSFVKRVLAKTASGYYFLSLNIQGSCNEQDNMRVSDAIHGAYSDTKLKRELKMEEHHVIGKTKSWRSEFDDEWLREVGDAGVGSDYAYDERQIFDLLRLERNTSHHLNTKATRKRTN
nr:hypothetical protein [Tanacetum cinerariifolium]